jgi:autotransporter-associated beta strand protein
MGAAGDLVVNGGTLNLNNAAQTVLSLAGNGGIINLANGHVFTVTPSANKTNASVISGLGAFVKEGTGALTLTGASDYSGGTTISAGKLVVNGSLGSGPVNVNGGTLAGSGTIGGATVINDQIAPGTSIGTMTFASSLTLAPTSTTLMEIDPSQTQNADLISAASISLDGVLVISQIGGTLLGGQTFNLFDGTLTGNFDSITGLPDVSADYWYWDTSEIGAGGNGELQLIPEPSTAATLMLGFFGLVLWRRFGRC